MPWLNPTWLNPLTDTAMMRHRFLLIGLVSALAGCTTTPPPAPVTDLPPQYAATTEGAATPLADPALPALHTMFPDPRLQASITAALAHNRNLRLALARVAEAAALYDIQTAAARPGVELGASGTRSRTPADLTVSGRTTVAGQYRAGVNLLAYEIDFWGRVRSLNEAALAQYLATDEARRAFETTLIAQVANTYLLARELDERIALAQQTLASREESFRIMRRRVEVGVNSELEQRQVETLLLATRSELAALQRQAAQADTLLTQLTGHAPLAAPPPRPLTGQGLDAEIAPGLPAALLTRRPDIRAAEQRLAAAQANVHAARAAFFPNIVLTASGGTASAGLDGLFQAGSGSWSFTPSLRMPLFDGGRTRANLNLAEARQIAAVADYEATVQTAFREVADALASRHWLSRQLAEQDALLRAESERARLASLRYERGASSYLDVLDAQRAQFAAEQARVQLLRAGMSATVELYKALGGGPQPDSEEMQ